MRARPLMGGRAAPPPRGGLERRLIVFVRGRSPSRVFEARGGSRPEDGSQGGMQREKRNGGGYTVSGNVSQVWEISGADAASVRQRGGSRLRGLILWRERVRAAARWWRGAGAGRRPATRRGRVRILGRVRPCVSKRSVLVRHDRACPMAVEGPKCWQHGVVRHVERLPGQSARAGCAQGGHSRSWMHVAVAPARSGPPASTASEPSRGPFCVCEREERRSFS